MRPKRPKISEAERARRAEQRRQALLEVRQLLVPRAVACRMLGNISTATAIRLEKLGRLQPVKPGGSPSGATFYRYDNVVAVANGEAEAVS